MIKRTTVILICFALLIPGTLLFGQAAADASAKILADTGPGLLSLVVYGKDKAELGRGSAVALAEGIAVTSYHLVSQAVSCTGFTSKKKEVSIDGIIAVDKNLDLALIKCANKVTPLSLGSPDDLAAGKKVIAVGPNESGDFTVSEGAVRALFDVGGNMKVADSSMAVPETFSGCAVVGENGKVIGILQILEKRLRFIVPVSFAAALPKTAKVTPFKSWQPEDYLGTLEASWLMGRLYGWTGINFEAQRNLEKVVKAQPNNLEAWTLLAKGYDAQRDYQNATTAYKKVTELDPKSTAAYLGLGQIYSRTQKSADAIAALEKALALDPQAKEAYLFLGNAYEDAHDFKKAGDAYDQYLATKPENAWATYQRLGNCRVNAEQYDLAAAAFVEALKSQPKDQNINYNLAQAYQKSGKLAEAEGVYKTLAEQNPKDADRWYQYVLTMYSAAQKPDKALEAAKKISELKPKDEQAIYNVGYMYQQMGKYQEAIDTYKQCLAVKPTYDYAWFQMGVCYYSMKNYKETIPAMQKNVEIVPDNVYGWLYMGMSYMQLKDFAKALDPMKKAADIQGDNANVLFNLGVIYLNLKDRYSALEVVKKLQGVDANLAAKLKSYIK